MTIIRIIIFVWLFLKYLLQPQLKSLQVLDFTTEQTSAGPFD